MTRLVPSQWPEQFPGEEPQPWEQPAMTVRNSRNPAAAMQKAQTRMPRAPMPSQPRKRPAPQQDFEPIEEDDDESMQQDVDWDQMGPSIQNLPPEYMDQIYRTHQAQAAYYANSQKKKSSTNSDHQQRLFAASLGF